jgi:hypothetical protein
MPLSLIACLSSGSRSCALPVGLAAIGWLPLSGNATGPLLASRAPPSRWLISTPVRLRLVAAESPSPWPPSDAAFETTARVSLPSLSATSSSIASPVLAAKGSASVTLRWLISAR